MKKNQPDLRPLIVERDVNAGGVTTMGLGAMGSGKTNSLVHITRRIFDRKARQAKELREANPPLDENTAYALRMVADELVFWIGEEDAQWRRLPDRLKPLLFVERGLKLEFFLNGESFDPTLIPFDSFEDLIRNAQPNRVNVVYLANPARVREFIIYLIKRPAPRWVSVIADECENYVPGYESGNTWHEVDELVRLIKRSRKRRVSLYSATQVKALVDHRFTALMMYWLIHKGAREIPQTRVYQGAIDALKLGQAWLANTGQFQKVSFPFYPAENDMVVNGLAHYEAPKPPVREKRVVN